MERNDHTTDDPDRLEAIFHTIIKGVDESMKRIDAVLDTLRDADDVPYTQAVHTRPPIEPDYWTEHRCSESSRARTGKPRGSQSTSC